MKKTLRVVTILLGIVLVFVAGLRWNLERQRKQRSPLQQSFGTVADFVLTERSGATVRLADLKGKYWVANFVFTRCQGPCPLMTTKMQELQRQFATNKKLHFVSFTVDPDFDKPAVLAKYADAYGIDKNQWWFLTGEKKPLYKLIRESFHLAVDDNGEVVHSTNFALVDPTGLILGYYNSVDENDIAAIREKLKDL